MNASPLPLLARQFHGWGANVLPIQRGQKKPIGLWETWQRERQAETDVHRLRWGDADRLGVINGISGIRSFDFDGCTDPASVERFLATLGLPDDYRWIEQSSSGNGWHVWVRCEDELPVEAFTEKKGEPGVFWGKARDGSFDHVELRWERNQTIIASSDGVDRWVNGAPDGPPTAVRIGDILTAFYAIATREQAAPPTPRHDNRSDAAHTSGDRAAIEAVKERFDLAQYAVRRFPNDVRPEPDGQLRILHHGGLIIDPERGIWTHFESGRGGDGIDFVGYVRYGDTWDKREKTMFREALHEAAEFAGVNLADYRPPPTPPRDPIPIRPPHDQAEPDEEPTQVPQMPNIEVLGIVRALAETISAADHFAVDGGGKLYVYEAGAYHGHGEKFVARRVKALLEEWDQSKKWSTHRAKEVTAYIATSAPLLWERPPADRINVANGILDITDVHHPCLIQHTPDYLSDVQIPVAYVEDATCDEWKRFSQQTLPEDAQNLLFEIAADLITSERSDQRSILFTGEGGNGKSTALTALTAFVGERNTANLSLHKLEDDRFAAAGLLGKLANICADLPSAHLAGTSMFKTITGGDAIQGEYKYGTAFSFRPFARLIFSANHLPRSGDSSDGFFRRWIVVPFDRTFDGIEALPRQILDARLAARSELSGVLNRALKVLPQVRAQGFTVSASMKNAWDEFRSTTDPFAVWLDREAIEGPDIFVSKDALCRAYNEHSEKLGRPAITKKAFTLALKKARPNLAEAQRNVEGRAGVWVWLGIGLKERGDDDHPPDTRSRDSRDSSKLFHEIAEPEKERERQKDENNWGNHVNHVIPDPPPALGEDEDGGRII